MLARFSQMRGTSGWTYGRVLSGAAALTLLGTASIAAEQRSFRLEEATITDVQRAILSKQLTAVDLVNLGVTVTDRKGDLVTDLKPEDFEVLEDGKKQTVGYFAALIFFSGAPFFRLLLN